MTNELLVIIISFGIFIILCIIFLIYLYVSKFITQKNINNLGLYNNILLGHYDKSKRIIRWNINDSIHFKWFQYNQIRFEDFIDCIISDNKLNISKIFNNYNNYKKSKQFISVILLLNKKEEKFIFSVIKANVEKTEIYFSLYHIDAEESIYQNQKNNFYKKNKYLNDNLVYLVNNYSDLFRIVCKKLIKCYKLSLLNKYSTLLLCIKINKFNDLINEFNLQNANEMKKIIANIFLNSFGNNCIAFYSQNLNYFYIVKFIKSRVFYINIYKWILKINYKWAINRVNNLYKWTKINFSFFTVYFDKAITEKKIVLLNYYTNHSFENPNNFEDNQIIKFNWIAKKIKDNKKRVPYNIYEEILSHSKIHISWIPIINYLNKNIFGNLIISDWYYGGVNLNDNLVLKKIKKNFYIVNSIIFKKRIYKNSLLKVSKATFIIFDINIFIKGHKYFINFFCKNKNNIVLFDNYKKIEINIFNKYMKMLEEKNIKYGLYNYEDLKEYSYVFNTKYKPKILFLKGEYVQRALNNKYELAYLDTFRKKFSEIELVVCNLKKIEQVSVFLSLDINLFTLITKDNKFKKPLLLLSKDIVKKYKINYYSEIKNNDNI